MNLFSMIVVGLIAGMVASWLMKAKTGILVDLILGVVGSVVGGWLSTLFLGTNLMSGINLTSILLALVGSIVVIAVYRFIRRKR